jgi:hypothetical protein
MTHFDPTLRTTGPSALRRCVREADGRQSHARGEVVA